MIGRTNESSVLEQAFNDSASHFIAIYGRRRVGKTYLIRETFRDRFAFQHAGLYNRPLSDQLFAFDASLKDAGHTPDRKSRNWMEAFEHLKDLIRQSTEKRKIIFFDELSWMDTRKSDLIAALEHFWNGWARARKDPSSTLCSVRM
jgi:AAA+ ATPase superfamily predicted ATPase